MFSLQFEGNSVHNASNRPVLEMGLDGDAEYLHGELVICF